jgi:phosphoglycolate phosphatase-like HAD superfamily hydrolase
VVKGIGAAYRLSLHMMTRTAVLLQDCDVEEWFTPYLKPFVHYIPVASDLSDLKVALKWVKDHPKEVQQIGENGRAFYEHYLTFTHHDQHIYEFVYRLYEYRHFQQQQKQLSKAEDQSASYS